MDSGWRPRSRAVAPILTGLLLLHAALASEAPAPAEHLPQDFTPSARGEFPNPRPLHAVYRFGWAAIPAAEGEVTISSPTGELRFSGKVSTCDWVRSLWKMDATLESRLNASTLRPIGTEQREVYRSETVVTRIDFFDNSVLKTRQEIPQDSEPKRKRFKLPQPFDIYGALMTVRSEPLNTGEKYRFVVFPTGAAFLAEVEVLGKERRSTRAGDFPATKLRLRLRRIGKNGRLTPHSKFKSGTGWISDDADRLLLRVESEVFVGSVWAELDRVEFDK